jgi:hypothetical protein
MQDDNSVYNSYTCNKGHAIEWKGMELLMTTKECAGCHRNAKSKAIIRWNCPECDEVYCQVCKNVIVCKQCPVGHELEFKKDYLTFSFMCDVCQQITMGKIDLWIDSQCDMGICRLCSNVTS